MSSTTITATLIITIQVLRIFAGYGLPESTVLFRTMVLNSVQVS